jgi:RimJ/RimL family protein N-acetyltransferase
MLKEIIVNKSSLLLVVEEGEELIGYLMAAGRNIKRIAHVVSISLGILQTHVGKGMGTRLFDELEKWARQNGKHRLELTVMENNTAGLALYKKMGFEVEGIKSRSLYVNGEYIDDIYMSKLI